MKIANLIINWLLWCRMFVIELKDHHRHLTKYESKGTKISIFKPFSELGKIWKCDAVSAFQKFQFPISLWNEKNLEIYTLTNIHICSLKTSNFQPAFPMFIAVHFTCRMLMNFWMKNSGVKREKKLFFCKLSIKDHNVFYTDVYLW